MGPMQQESGRELPAQEVWQGMCACSSTSVACLDVRCTAPKTQASNPTKNHPLSCVWTQTKGMPMGGVSSSTSLTLFGFLVRRSKEEVYIYFSARLATPTTFHTCNEFDHVKRARSPGVGVPVQLHLFHLLSLLSRITFGSNLRYSGEN